MQRIIDTHTVKKKWFESINGTLTDGEEAIRLNEDNILLVVETCDTIGILCIGTDNY